MNYHTHKILDDNDIVALKDYASQIDWEVVFQDYNLFHLKRYDTKTDPISAAYKKIADYASRVGACDTGFGAYFLKYEEGSFTRMHKDNESRLTIVTMVDQSDDLVGGDAIVREEYRSPEGGRDSTQKCVRADYEKDRPPYGQEIIMDVVPVEDGESLIYGNDLDHAVGRVRSGQRIVLITWFR